MSNTGVIKHRYSYSCECSLCVAHRPTEKEIYFVMFVNSEVEKQTGDKNLLQDLEHMPREGRDGVLDLIAFMTSGLAVDWEYLEKHNPIALKKITDAHELLLRALDDENVSMAAFKEKVISWGATVYVDHRQTEIKSGGLLDVLLKNGGKIQSIEVVKEPTRIEDSPKLRKNSKSKAKRSKKECGG